MEKKMVFSSTTAAVRYYIMQYVSQNEREYERRELVDYINQRMADDENVTAGVIAGAVKMLVCSGELLVVKRGVFKKGVKRQNGSTLEKIFSVCQKFTTDFEKACTVNVLMLSEEERLLYPEIVETLEIGRANIYDFMEQLDVLLKKMKAVGNEMDVAEQNAMLLKSTDTGEGNTDTLGDDEVIAAVASKGENGSLEHAKHKKSKADA